MRVRLLVGAAVVVAVGAAGGVAWARTASGSPGYRTAAVTRGAVTATLDLTGTIAPLQAATVGFAQGGTVASVDVAAGDQVTAGQPLAQLDLTALEARLTQAQATEAAAQQTLTAAQDAQVAVVADPPPATGTSTAVSSAQKAVLAAQKAVDTALATSQKALAAATAACPGASPSPTASPSASPSSPSDPPPDPRSRPSGSTSAPASGQSTSPAPDPQACLTAESAVLTSQTGLAAKQAALNTALSTLTQALTKAASASSARPSNAPTAAPVSTTQLAAYQATMDADAAAVTVAQQQLAQGTITSPLSGTVVAVGLAPGQTVAAASSTAVIEVVAPGGYQVATTVPTADVGEIVVGQHATVVPDGTATALAATVTSVAPAPMGNGYPVTLAFGAPATGLHAGASASVALTTGSAAGSLVVPTSAVRAVGNRHVVAVLTDGSPVITPVTIGTVGPVRTQILSGLREGQQVVLADLSSTVTSDSATNAGAARFALVSRGGGGGARRGGG